MSEEVTIGDVQYRIGKMDARTQLHIARRLSPIMSALVGLIRQEDQGASIEDVLKPIANQLAGMPDAEVDYILDRCLAVCSRENDRHGTGWGPVMASNGRLMFQDITVAGMLQLAAAVIQENLAGFFGDLGSLLGALRPPTA
jgi:hypothetical protein